jgi:hypothetical protein
LSQRANLHLALGGSFETAAQPSGETKLAEASRH